jgi:hypothetical protein
MRSCLSAISGIPLACLLFALAIGNAAHATDPEIMVHENDIAERGEIVATLHANYTARGSRQTGDTTWPSDKLTNLMAEFATGLAPQWEIGLHLPIMRAGVTSESSTAGSWGSSGVMLRIKHIDEWENGFFLGFNAEYDVYAQRYATDNRSIELRGIVGLDTENYRLTLNPALMWGLGSRVEEHAPYFAVSGKALYKLNPQWGFGAEFYSNWGAANNLLPGDGDRLAYLIGEWLPDDIQSVHFGIGRGFRNTSDWEIFKLVWTSRC